MAYPNYAQPPAPKTRPTTVRVSSYLLYVTAAVGVIIAILSLSQIGTMNRVYKEVYTGTPAQGSEAAAGIGAAISAVFYILFAVGMVVLAHFNNKGSQASRVTTWVIAGITACCTAGGAVANGLTNAIVGSLGNTGSGGGPSASEVQQKLNDALPPWYTGVTITLEVITALAALGAIILLALPASNAYFRKTQPGFDPSMPYPQYGGPAPYPGQQGQPPYPGQGGQYSPYPGQTGSPGGPGSPAGQPGQYSGGQPGQYPGGQSSYPGGQGWQPPYPGQPTSGGGPSGPQSPHTGSIPPTDPWNQPRRDGEDRPPNDPTAGR